MKVVVIPADTAEPVRVEDVEKIDLAFLQKITGGYIEAISFGKDDLSMYLNEEGKLDGLPRNRRATALAQGSIQYNDYIVGNAVITGPVDDEGYDTGLTDEQIGRLTA
jgi:hypothetical protein